MLALGIGMNLQLMNGTLLRELIIGHCRTTLPPYSPYNSIGDTVRILQLLWSRMESYGGIQSYIKTMTSALKPIGTQVFTHGLPSASNYQQVYPDAIPRISTQDFSSTLTSLVHHYRADIIETHNVLSGFTPAIAVQITECSRLCRIPHITIMHDVQRPNTTIQWEYMQHVLTGTHVIVTSEFNQNRFKRFFAQPTILLSPGIDFELFTPASKPNLRTVAYPGRLTALKGADDGIRLLGGLTHDLGKITLLLSSKTQNCFGEHPSYFAELDRVAAEYSALTVLYNAGLDDVHKMYSDAALTLVLSKYEGFGLVPLESIASCRPVVAIPSGGMGWLYNVSGAICAPSLAGASAGVKDVLNNWAVWHDKAVQSRKALKDLYDVRIIAARYLSVLRWVRERTPQCRPSCSS